MVALVSGRGKNPANVIHVGGRITFDGKPSPFGVIVFEPDPSRGNRGPQGHANIKDGHFDTAQSQKGVVVGPQIVRITGGDGVNPEPVNPFGTMLFDECAIRMEFSRDQATLQFDVPRPRSTKTR